MSDDKSVTVQSTDIVQLARGVRLRVDDVRGRTVLLAPERALALDDIAVTIVNALDGVRSIDDICDDLAARFSAPRERVAHDVLAFIQELANRRLIDIKERP